MPRKGKTNSRRYWLETMKQQAREQRLTPLGSNNSLTDGPPRHTNQCSTFHVPEGYVVPRRKVPVHMSNVVTSPLTGGPPQHTNVPDGYVIPRRKVPVHMSNIVPCPLTDGPPQHTNQCSTFHVSDGYVVPRRKVPVRMSNVVQTDGSPQSTDNVIPANTRATSSADDDGLQAFHVPEGYVIPRRKVSVHVSNVVPSPLTDGPPQHTNQCSNGKRNRYMQQYMKRKRNDSEFKFIETNRQRSTRATKRENPLYKQHEQTENTAKNTAKHAKKRKSDELYKQHERTEDTERRAKKRKSDELYKQHEQTENTANRAKKRQSDELYKQHERTEDTERRAKKRKSDELYKQHERTEDTERRAKKRKSDELYKQHERTEDTERRAKKRKSDELYKQHEQTENTANRAKKRQSDELYKQHERTEDTERRAKTRKSDELYKQHERTEDTERRAKKRKSDDVYKQHEKARDTAFRQKSRERTKPHSINDIIEQFRNKVSQGPIYICTVCNQLLYKHSVTQLSDALKHSQRPRVRQIVHESPRVSSIDNKVWICRTCKSYVSKGNVPPMSVLNHMKFPAQDILKDLNPLELTLLAVRLPFMKIHQAPRGKQKMMHGNMVLVPADVDNTVKQLPRIPSNTATIKVKLKRRLKYKHHVYCLNVRPHIVKNAAKYLSTTPLCKQYITYDEKWRYPSTSTETVDRDSGNEVNCNIDLDETLPPASTEKEILQAISTDDEIPINNTENEIPINNTENEIPITATENEIPITPTENEIPFTATKNEIPITPTENEIPITTTENEIPITTTENEIPITPTENEMLPIATTVNGVGDDNWSEDEDDAISGEADTMLTAQEFVEPGERDLVYNFAPGEYSIPVSVFMDKDCEELAFPGIFCGQKRPINADRTVKVTYGDIVKSELRNSDRRAAANVEHLFFKTKKIQMKTLIDQTQLALRKVTVKGKSVTAKDVKGTEVKNMIHNDKAYKFLASIRGSPPYFEKVSKDLFGMIRQLGPTTFFVTLSAAETRWLHLLRILGKVVDKREYTDDELEQLTWDEKCRLIQSDPITCARHFDYAVSKFISDFVLSKCHPLGEIEDFFYRIEYQQRGSPHVHSMFWVKDAPQYGVDSDEDVCQFVDQYITCALPEEDDPLFELVSLQTHRHSHTCKKKREKKCRFGFPKPPLSKTTILQPLSQPEYSQNDIDSYRTKYSKIEQQLNNIEEVEELNMEDFLQKLEMTEEEYILSVRASVKTPTIFLKRSLKESRINNYNYNMLRLWRANTDIQFVLDVYACATYVASYVTKTQRGMSELLRKAADEVKIGNLSLKDQVRTVGNKFLNAVEISAQEAAYICLQLPMKRASRQTIFVNTSPPDERVTLLKPQAILETMDDDDDNIQCSNLITRYTDRPKSLENITLADFASFYEKSP